MRGAGRLQSIRRMIDKKTVDVYAMFNDELNAIKKELTQKLVALPASHPKYAGQAHWARMLKRGIERSMMVNCSYWLSLFSRAAKFVNRCHCEQWCCEAVKRRKRLFF